MCGLFTVMLMLIQLFVFSCWVVLGTEPPRASWSGRRLPPSRSRWAIYNKRCACHNEEFIEHEKVGNMPHPQILTSHLLYSKVLRGKMLHNNFTFSVKNDRGQFKPGPRAESQEHRKRSVKWKNILDKINNMNSLWILRSWEEKSNWRVESKISANEINTLKKHCWRQRE